MKPRFLILVDSFKNSISSKDIGSLLSSIIPNSKYYPISDGGEGFLDTIKAVKTCKEIKIKTISASYKEVEANVLIDEENNAYFESSEVIGYKFKNELSILERSSFGIGDVLKELNKFNVNKVYIGLGGTSTSDIGVGLLSSLGAKFFVGGVEIEHPKISDLISVDNIDLSELNKINYEISIVNDVTNPLLGKNGANFVFAKQKGASEEEIETLEKCFENFEKLVSRQAYDIENDVGDGSAGGLGFTFKHILNAHYLQGIDFILLLINIDKIKKSYDYVITGEGRLDNQSFDGKVVGGILKHFPKSKVIIVAGQNLTSKKNNVFTLVPAYIDNVEESINNPKVYLKQVALDIKNKFCVAKRVTHTFPVFYNEDSEILILGSFPSEKSRSENFYYMHRGNRFYKILSEIFEESIPESVDGRKEFLSKHKIALYDVIDECEIVGSDDSSIANPQPTNLKEIISRSRIKKIIVNGKTAEFYFKKFFNDIDILTYFLPSTSARNAHFKLNELVKAYKTTIFNHKNILNNY